MTQSNKAIDYISSETFHEWEKQMGASKVVVSTSFSIQSLLDGSGNIDYTLLIQFFEKNNEKVSEFFQEKENIEKILFPFFDFLKQTFFFENKTIPDNILCILQNNASIRRGIVTYVEEKNLLIISSQHIEQYDVIAFHFFLLGMNQDFDIVKDVQLDHFTKINGLFTDSIVKIWRILGTMDVFARKNPPEVLINELYSCIQLGETINKLALIHAVNFEERRISFELGMIIRNNIDSLLRQLDPNFVQEHIIGKKLNYLAGRVQCNFAHGSIITGTSVEQIEEQVAHIKKEQQAWFDRQKASDFWWNGNNKMIAEIILLWNQTIIDLIGMEKKKELLSPPFSIHEEERKKELLYNFVRIYSFGSGKNFLKTEEVINDFIEKGIIKDEYQIETIYNIVLFDFDIKNESLIGLMNFFLNADKQVNNFFYEEFVLKIISQIIRRFHKSSEYFNFLPLIEKINVFLKKKNVSSSILSHSKVYLSLALYYIECPGKENQEFAKKCFIHYKNLSASFIGTDKNPNYSIDEKTFYISLWRSGEVEQYGKQSHHNENLEIGWKYMFEQATEQYKQSAILSIEEEVGKIIASMNIGNDIYSQEQINNLLGKKITEIIFYNLCTINIAEYCQRRNSNNRIACDICQKTPESKEAECLAAVWKHGFYKKHIPLDWGIFITFTYPSISEKIFEKIFSEHRALMKERFGNLIAINNKNARLQESQEKLKRDTETGLLNGKMLNFDTQKLEEVGENYSVAFIEIIGYEELLAMRGAVSMEESLNSFVSEIQIRIAERDHITLYRYDAKTFAIVDSSRGESNSPAYLLVLCDELSLVLWEKKIDFDIRSGVAIQELMVLRKARIALWNARMGQLYSYTSTDGEKADWIIRKTAEFKEAMSKNQLFPVYQMLCNPNNPEELRVEVLARFRKPDGTIVSVGAYADIIEKNNWYPEITKQILPQAIIFLKEKPELRVSVNLHAQDWNNITIMQVLRDIATTNSELVDRITIEILENVKLGRPDDMMRVKELRSLGFRRALDDFLTWESNAERVVEVDPDYIKIDQKIIRMLFSPETREAGIKVIKNTVLLAQDFGCIVTAEGIEKEVNGKEVGIEVSRLLLDLGVTYLQGYYFNIPMTREELEREYKNIQTRLGLVQTIANKGGTK